MREWLLGAVGAVALYSTVWARTVPERQAAVVEATAASAGVPGSATQSRKKVRPSRARAQQAKAPRPEPAAARPRPAAAPTPPPVAAAPGSLGEQPDVGLPAPSARERSREERVDELPVELPARLRKTFERLSELQQLGPDPNRLAERVQGLDVDPAEIQELRDFARQFVDLPPERVDLGALR